MKQTLYAVAEVITLLTILSAFIGAYILIAS